MKLRDKINENELDLSLNELTEIPVKEMLAIPKATHVDLSSNLIKTLPLNFATLTHIIKLDLSKNALTELPQNFGNLHNLQYLDLYGNKLTTLPVSFCRLKNLRWLDLKNNPLEPQLKTVAGDCLVQEQCQKCAKQVVAYMQSIESELERAKQKKLKEEREREAAAKLEEQKALEKARQLKKAERQKRKMELREEKLRRQQEEIQKNEDNILSETKDTELNGVIHSPQAQNKSGSWISYFMILLLIPLTMIGTAVALYMYMGHKVETYNDIQKALEETWKQTNKHGSVILEIIKVQAFKIKEILILWTDHIISYWMSYIDS